MTNKQRPQIGHLYRFRGDNVDYVSKKYGLYYTGLAMCIEEDVLDDFKIHEATKDSPLPTVHINNSLYKFELYNSKRYNVRFSTVVEAIDNVMYFTEAEFRDMMEPIYETH